MALPPWTIELLRRGLSDVARKASEPETLEKIKSQATEILQELPETAARGIDAVMRSAEASKQKVQNWSRKHTALAIPVLNASGVLVSEYGNGVRLDDEVIEIGREFFAGDAMSGPMVDDRLDHRLQKRLPSGGGYSIAVTSSFSSALTALSLLIQQRQLVVHRNHAVRLPSGVPLPDAFGMLVPVIQEVGSVGSISPRDFDSLEQFCVIMADGGEKPIELIDLSRHDAMQAVVLPVGTVEELSSGDIPSAEAMLAAGADFVVVPGDGLCGGPSCGLLIGREKEMDLIRSSSVWPALAASNAVEAMMVVALEKLSAGSEEVPMLALLQANEENLRGRAERMATRLSGSDSIQITHVTAEEAKLTETGRWRFPSRQVRLRHASMSAAEWSEKLRDEMPSVLAGASGEDLCIDLRWIDATNDTRLVDALLR
jgi:L-seryl-tRNA(Ser) seleniumtransferase